jgi:type II secretory pathway component GspD/PulD (secretin)
MNFKKSIFAIASAVLVAGCAGPSQYQMAKDQSAAYVDRFKEERAARSVVRESDTPYVRAEAVEYRPALRGGVSLNLKGVPLQTALASALEKSGYDLSFVGKVDPQRPVSMSVTNQSFEKVANDIAFAAGYVAVFDHANKRVMIADEATFTYRIDPHSLEGREDNYSTNSNPGGSGGSSGGSSSSSGSGSGGSSGGDGAAVATSSIVKLGATNKGGAEEFLATVRGMVGAGPKDSAVSYVALTGMLVVRGNSAALRRVTDFVELHQRDARTEVQLEAAIVEVTLGDEFQYGIDWGRVVPLGGTIAGHAAINIGSRGVVASPAVTANITTNSVSAVIKALRERTVVNVVAEPWVSSLNHREGFYTRATQKPYVPEISQSTVQNAGTTSSGKLAYVPDGIQFAFKPSVVSPNVVRARILPVITTVGDQHNFQLGQSQLTGFDVGVSQSHLEVELEAGKTSIVGGLNLDRANNLDSGVPGISDVPLLGSLITSKTRNGQKTQTVLLLRANIIPPRSGQSTLIGESL